ncbi:MAG: NADH-quinone oxidoreductase subunit L [Chloroflexi bacterium]|nr:NADH-quinone oxidoreductase subunit L [Chloroflexota bacterium]
MYWLDHAWIIPAIPACAFIALFALGKRLPRGGDWLSITAIGSGFVLFFFVLEAHLDSIQAGLGGLSNVGFNWLQFEGFTLRIGFTVDSIALVMLGVVTLVALLVQIYSVAYMRHHGKPEPRYWWYFAVHSLFVAAMLALVLADNLLLLYIAWEGVGLCSFLLIGFYYEKRSAVEAAKKAFVTTRLGDVGLLIGIILLWRATGSFQISDIIAAAQAGRTNDLAPVMSDGYLILATLMVFLGAMGKSAQFPFHVWLPDAMEGPTPVSALIHAATMVVAGVYLVARLLPLFDVTPGALQVVTAVGLTTALLAGVLALVQTDIKRVLAYSTVSQLGFMFVALGAGAVGVAIFHLLTHAVFKALLFLGSGSVIHMTEEQDARRLGGLWWRMPVTTLTFAIGALALAGIPPLAGFFSKDEIFVVVNAYQSDVVLILMGLAAFLSALYMARLVIITFLGSPKDLAMIRRAREAPLLMVAPLVFLAVLTLLVGFFAFDQVGRALGFPGGINYYVYFPLPHEFHFDDTIAAATGVASLAGIGAAFWLFWGKAERAQRLAAFAPPVTALVQNKFYMDDLYQAAIDRLVLPAGRAVAVFDRVVVNDTGINGPADFTRYGASWMRYHVTGRIPDYALFMVLGIAAAGALGFLVRL